jgi:hypothetical protein
MSSKFGISKFMMVGLIVAMAFAFVFSSALAKEANGEGTFEITVKHRINGAKLGLDPELPVNVNVYKDGEFLAQIPDFRYGDNFSTQLPAGEYFVEVTLADGTPIGLTLGPVEIPADVRVTVIAKLTGEGPILEPRIREMK